MNVLHIIPSISPRDGGPTFALRTMARAIAQAGCDVAVATTGDVLSAGVGAGCEAAGVRLFRFPKQTPGSWTFSWPLTRWLYAEARRYDVLHIHALFSYPTIPACDAARRAGRPYILRPFGTLDSRTILRKAWKKLPYYLLVERRHLENAAAIHATSTAEAEAIAKLGFGDKTHVIPHSVELPTAPDARRERAPDQPLRLLYLSRLHPIKNLPVLFAALARLGDQRIELIIAGDGDPAYRAELQATAASLGVAGRVQFRGFVDGPAKARLYAEADLFVLPSEHENFGVSVAEAMAAGLPVVVSAGVALADQVARAGAGAVATTGDPVALADAIRGLIDPAARLAAGIRARTLAAERFDHDSQGRALVALYQQLIARHAA